MAEEQTGERTRRSVSGELEEAREELAGLRRENAKLREVLTQIDVYAGVAEIALKAIQARVASLKATDL